MSNLVVKMKVYYISFYLNETEIKDRELVVAPQSKIKYISESIQKAGYDVCLVSTSYTKKGKSFSFGRKIKINQSEIHIYLPALGSNNFFFKLFRTNFMQIQLFYFLFKNVKSNDIILAYHSLSYMAVLKFIKLLKKIKLVLELNDLYALHYESLKKIERLKKKECSFFSLPDSFLFASPYMNELLTYKRPSIISYGSYQVVKEEKVLSENIETINIVYTGVIENLRKAAILVANTAIFLPKNYIIHIAGYGTKQNINDLKELIHNINNQKGYEAIVFHGLLLGSKLNRLLSNCLICINCHTYKNEDIWKSKFSFPSKIPFNMGHDLYLVSHDMDIISKSPFAKYTTFFSNFNPEEVANAIVTCSASLKKQKDGSPKQLIKKLDDEFVNDIKKLFNQLIFKR